MAGSVVQQMSRRIVHTIPTPTYSAAAAVLPVGLSVDSKTWYGRRVSDNTVMTSTNDGSSWTAAHTITAGDVITDVIEMGNGEVLVVTDTGTNTGSIYVSRGWATDPTTATWVKTLTTVTSAGNHNYFDVGVGSVNVDPLGGPIVVASEYGKQTGGLADPENAAVHSWISGDYGVTWSTLVDLLTLATTGSRHIHGVAYDPWWDRVWLVHGDAGSTGFYEIFYSDDYRNALTGGTPTWTRLDRAKTVASHTTAGYQALRPIPLPSCILFGVDDQPNVAGYRLGRRGWRQYGRMTLLNRVTLVSSPTPLCRPTRNGQGGVLIAATGTGTGFVALFYSPDGHRFWKIAQDTSLTSTVWRTWGPSSTGVVLGSSAGVDMLTVSSVNEPAYLPPRVGGVASVANAGTIAHGLGFIPATYSVTPTAAGHIAAVTAVDATNLTVSLTVASTGAAVSVAENVGWSAGSQ